MLRLCGLTSTEAWRTFSAVASGEQLVFKWLRTTSWNTNSTGRDTSWPPAPPCPKIRDKSKWTWFNDHTHTQTQLISKGGPSGAICFLRPTQGHVSRWKGRDGDEIAAIGQPALPSEPMTSLMAALRKHDGTNGQRYESKIRVIMNLGSF